MDVYSEFIICFSHHNLCFLTHPTGSMNKSFSIQSHLSNACSFLNQCKAKHSIKMRELFWWYMIACSWQRMKAHTDAWWFGHVIHSLCNITYVKVIETFFMHGQVAHEECCIAHNDILLVEEVLCIFEFPAFVKSILSHCPELQLHSVDGLVAACNAWHSHKKGSGKPFMIYLLFLSGVFHQFIMAVLIGHTQALWKLDALSLNMETLDVGVIDGFEGVFIWTNLLRCLVWSQVFHVHLAVLAKAKLLKHPQNKHYQKAVRFAEEWELGCSDHVMSVPAQEGEAGDTEPSVVEIALWDVDVIIQKLVSMGATNVGAADIMEQFSAKSKKHPTIIFQASFIALKRLEENVTWTGIEHMMESLSFQQEDITTLKEAMDAKSHLGQLAPIFQKMMTLKEKGSTCWTAMYHCEAILVIFLISGVIEGDLDSDFCIKV